VLGEDYVSRTSGRERKWTRFTRFLVAFAALVVVAGSCSLVSADGEVKGREQIRKKLIEAYEGAPSIHRAWSVVKSGSGQKRKTFVELFRDGAFVGVSLYRLVAPSDIPQEESLVVTDGEYIIGTEKAEGGKRLVWPGVRWLNRRRELWNQARALLQSLGAPTLKTPREWCEQVSLDLGGDPPHVSATLCATAESDLSASWLAPTVFDAGQMHVKDGIVTVESGGLLRTFDLADGLPQVVRMTSQDGTVVYEMVPAKPHRSFPAWRDVIQSECGAASKQAPGVWDMEPQIHAFSRILASAVGQQTDVVRHADLLRSQMDILLAVMIPSSYVDHSMEQATANHGGDPAEQGNRLARLLYFKIWEVLVEDLRKGKVAAQVQESVRLCLWSSLSSRFTVAAAMIGRQIPKDDK
jgi:hypothetical protein